MGKDLVDIILERRKYKAKYFKNYKVYSQKIAAVARKVSRDARILVFGSIIKGRWHPDSDIDILIISEGLPAEFEARARIKTAIKSAIGPFSPFQIHLATPEEFEKWYRRTLKDNYLEI